MQEFRVYKCKKSEGEEAFVNKNFIKLTLIKFIRWGDNLFSCFPVRFLTVK